tara:strand:+ start:291 stop:497 length:207 start_codon:yes stop_codon:yes gene_type:complete
MPTIDKKDVMLERVGIKVGYLLGVRRKTKVNRDDMNGPIKGRWIENEENKRRRSRIKGLKLKRARLKP